MSNITPNKPKKEYSPPFWVSAVKARMKQRNVSQERIAAKLGVERSAVGHYFSGKNALPISSVDVICDMINLKRDVFFEPTEQKSQVTDSDKSEYNFSDDNLSTHSLKLIKLIVALDKEQRITQDIARSIITLLKSYR